MTESDTKLLLLNATTMGISMAHIEVALKLLLLAVSIGYTFQRWYFLRRDKVKTKK
jgi:hypothetical protein|tara:strand:- start:266 stop:433 length:168 start_codon:yes stop_codon:yes gene_type:complete